MFVQQSWWSGYRLSVALLGFALVIGGFAGCGAPSDREDSGAETSTSEDAGSEWDAGEVVPDAGSQTQDAGQGGVDAGMACTDDTWTNYAKGFFSTNCLKCHSFASSYSQVKSARNSIRTRINSGAMPKDKTLSSTEKARILKWIDCGVPQ